MGFYFRYPNAAVEILGVVLVNQGDPNPDLADAWPIKISDGVNFAALVDVNSSQTVVAAPGQSLAVFSVIAGWDGASHHELLTDVSGRLEIGSISGTVTLPTGASTSALQIAGNASLASIDSKLANNYGVSTGAIRTASQIGNTTGAADFGAGSTTAQTLRTVIVTDQTTIPVSVVVGDLVANQGTPAALSDAWPIKVSDGLNFAALSNIGNAQAIVATPGESQVTLAVMAGWDGVDHREVVLNPSGKLIVAQVDNISTISGPIVLPTGASTSALQTTGNASLASIDGKLANNYGVSTGAIRTASQIGNAAGAADFGAGNVTAQTIRIVVASDQAALPSTKGRAFANVPVRNDYTSVNVTTAAYTQLVASTSLTTNLVEVFDSSGQTLLFAVGPAASEVNQFIITPGGNGQVPLAIPAGSRVSIKALSATANTGEIDVNFYT